MCPHITVSKPPTELKHRFISYLIIGYFCHFYTENSVWIDFLLCKGWMRLNESRRLVGVFAKGRHFVFLLRFVLPAFWPFSAVMNAETFKHRTRFVKTHEIRKKDKSQQTGDCVQLWKKTSLKCFPWWQRDNNLLILYANLIFSWNIHKKHFQLAFLSLSVNGK